LRFELCNFGSLAFAATAFGFLLSAMLLASFLRSFLGSLLTLTFGVAAGVSTGFAFHSSGLPRFSGLWFCDQLGNTLDFDELGRRGQDRKRF
jgi:hypothetical protein